MTNPTSYTDEQVLSAIEALGSYETMCGFAHILAGVFADRQRLQAEVEALRTEAERYRWLRDTATQFEQDVWLAHLADDADNFADRNIGQDSATLNETKEAKS